MSLTGRTRKSDNHDNAVDEVKAAGPEGAKLAPILSRLFKLKTKSQYQPVSVAAADATRAIVWAERLLSAAEAAVSTR